jgi:hypothetical protein
MTDMKPNLTPSGRINIAWRKTAHLTGKAVAVENFCAEFRRNDTVKLDGSFRGLFR